MAGDQMRLFPAPCSHKPTEAEAERGRRWIAVCRDIIAGSDAGDSPCRAPRS